MSHCWYVSQTWGVHDHRWVTALTNQGFEPTVLSLERDAISLTDVRSEIGARGEASPVVAGPLVPVTQGLIDLPNTLVGLSWGFDLLELNASNRNGSWLSQLSHLIVDSSSTRAIAETAGVDPSQISTIPWGIDVELFTPEGSRLDLTTFEIAAHRPTVLSLRALEPLYRVEEAIRAWPDVLAKYPDAMLLIGNDGSLRSELYELVEQLDLTDNVTFIGRVPEAELPSLLRAVRLYVSTSPVDGTSVTMLQAMGCGTSVITTDTPGNREWVEPGVTGRVYLPGSAADLAKRILEALADDSGGDALMAFEARAMVVARANWYENQRELGRILTAG